MPQPWRLIIAGPDENGHQQEVQQLANSLGIAGQVSFPGPVSDELKWQLYQKADIFVLPSFSENFGIVIAEALAAGLPVIATHGTPWKELNHRNAGWHVPTDVLAIAAALREATSMDDVARRKMGLRGSEWARSEFGWQGIAGRMAIFYRSLLAGRSELSPDVVSTLRKHDRQNHSSCGIRAKLV